MKVYFIGAGPGDPELVSVKAMRVLKTADVVLYDYLVHPNIILAAKDAEKVCVGKKKGAHSTQQKDINQLLVKYAKEGKVVARLKGGDPMVFGRCGEEMTALNEARLPFEIIPGITSAISVPTYAGIPITHRDHSHSVAFVTATRANDIGNMAFPNADTLVIMMSLLRLSGIVARLTELRSPDTPIAIIEAGTYANERVLVGTLANIETMQENAQLNPPALMVVGDVAQLHHQFNWRAHLPLRNRRFVVSRSHHQQSTLVDQLANLGAEVLTIPMNDILPNDSALKNVNLSNVTHIIFTSENGVRSFFRVLTNNAMDARLLANKQIIAIGQHTASILTSFGILPDMIPSVSTSKGIIDALKTELNSSHHLLIPTSCEADNAFETLSATGANVTTLSIYNNRIPADIDLKTNWIKPDDIFIFMNTAAVNRLHDHYDQLPAHTVFSIGPMTSQALRRLGVPTIHESDAPSIEAVIQKIIHIFERP
jgi:uroporphyrinogen III methyltransferase/synthase